MSALSRGGTVALLIFLDVISIYGFYYFFEKLLNATAIGAVVGYVLMVLILFVVVYLEIVFTLAVLWGLKE